MEKYTFTGQPKLRILTDEQIKLIHLEALHVLEKTGVKFESEEALKILKDNGAVVDFDKKIAKINPQMVDDAVKKAPNGFRLYNREGELAANMSNNNVHFDPGSSMIKFMESDGKTVRKTESKDLIEISRLNDAMQNIHLQSTSVVCYDVPELIGDSYRLYLCLKNSPKAIITGAFSVRGVTHMREMLAAVAGGYDQLREKPLAVFDICPSPPLKWTHISAQNIIDCARYDLPLETVALPMPGAGTPVTLAGSVVVHTAETLSGLVLAQCINPGARVVYGGAPVQFDMRFGTTPFSAVEATMMAAAYAQMGKYFGMPTHTYAALSDSKTIDTQAGIETGMSGIIAQLAGINMISGPGSLDFVNTFSLEKLAIDNEVCGMALRMQKGIDCSPESLAIDVIDELGPGGAYLEAEHTFRWFKKEPYIPSLIIDRHDRKNWEDEGSRSAFQRAQERVKEIKETHTPLPLGDDREEKLDTVTREIMKELKISELPQGPK
ncbi:MAG: trimethylamine methyltransferase family protein [Bacillota bacterium]|nr:trimethylamine methyltransferase family protein [Bacillota bacterium]